MAHPKALSNKPSGKQMGRDTGFTEEWAPSVEKTQLRGLQEVIR